MNIVLLKLKIDCVFIQLYIYLYYSYIIWNELAKNIKQMKKKNERNNRVVTVGWINDLDTEQQFSQTMFVNGCHILGIYHLDFRGY